MKPTIIAVIIAFVFIAGSVWLSNNRDGSSSENVNNVSIVDGKQVIEINARGGYSPRKSTAKAGIPTIIKFNTSGTFDCSSYVSIPSLNISKVLPQTGETPFDIGSQPVGKLKGTCSMGMYRFEVDFIE